MLESEKYEALWNRPEYRQVAPGEAEVLSFLKVASPEIGASLLDFGCGTGRAAQKLKDAGLKVIGVDFAANSLDSDVDIPVIQHDLTKPLDAKAKYGFCTDVMEHIPPEDVQTVLRNITRSAKNVYFVISCVEDRMGALIGEPLHLTVEDHDWWGKELEAIGAKVLWSKDRGLSCAFYVSTVTSPTDLIKDGKLNVSEDQVRENIKVNCSKGYKLCEPSQQQDIEIMLLGGGPSINDFVDDIRAKREAGMPLVTTNGSYNWCLERGIKPSAQIIVDAREFNQRFLTPVVDGCKYLLASQCHPSLLESVPKDQVYLWHSAINPEAVEYIKSVSDGQVWPVPGGSTVMLRAIPLLRMLGFPKFHIYGFDSCVMGDHHAYEQKENDLCLLKTVVNGREFLCQLWMAVQAEEFKELAQRLDKDCKLAVYGDGLIAHLINSAKPKD